MSRIIIGDCHGCYDTLIALIKKLPAGVPITFAGDLIDRGPKSAQVIDFVRKNNHDCVAGNHEVLMLEAGGKPHMSSIWGLNGGIDCERSYRNEEYELDKKQLADDMKWLRNLPLYIEYPECKNEDGRHLVVSHSSVGKVWGWTEERINNNKDNYQNVILWGRSAPKDAPDIYNVFGHTPQEIEPTIKSFYANVDTGCFYRGHGHGILTALQFPEMKVYQQLNIDDYPGFLVEENWKDHFEKS